MEYIKADWDINAQVLTLTEKMNEIIAWVNKQKD